MADDPVPPPASEVNAVQTVDVPIRPEPASDLSAIASATMEPSASSVEALSISQSAGTQPEPTPVQDQPPADVITEAPVAPEPPQSPEVPSSEPVSTSTSPQAEPSVSTPPADVASSTVEPIKEDNQTVQADTEPQGSTEAQAIPTLHLPYYSTYPISFDFGAQSSDENIQKKYQEWGIVGHNGIDFGLPEGTDVLACDDGTVTQVGDNGDFGISITIKHSWGTSIYCHLQSFGVLVNDHVTKAQVVGASGQTGFVTGPHLHFGIQPNNPNTTNGYLGYINPNPYLSETSEKPQPEKPSDLSAQSDVPVSPVLPQSPLTPQIIPQQPETPQPEISQDEIQKQAVAMFDARVKENSVKGNQAKKVKRDEALQKIFTFAQEKKKITNEQARDLLHISQSTATEYLTDLVARGMLKIEGKGKATVYVF